MRVAVTGANGLFGCGLVEGLQGRNTVFSLTRADADITDAAAIRSAFVRVQPDLVIHPAGIPDLDICEADPETARRVNVEGTRSVVEAARGVGAAVVFISTDAVFDGTKREPYLEADPTNPPTVYGGTKLLAEEIVQSLPHHFIFRVSVLFGPGKTNFVEKGLRKIAAGEDYIVASDQLGSATYTLDAAAKIMEVVEARRCGLYHLSNSGACTRFELARTAAALAGLDPARVIGKPMAEMGRRASRLAYAVMEMRALRDAGFAPPRPWQDALADYIRSRPTDL